MSRYNNQRVMINTSENFEEQFESRDVGNIEHYRIQKLSYPSETDDDGLTYYRHTWRVQDKFYHIAAKYYKDSTLWWVIAQYNQRPTEQHCKEGEILKIPFPLARVLRIME